MKKKISDYINHYLKKHAGEEDKMAEFAIFIEDFFSKVPDEHAVVHSDFYSEIENFADEIDEEMILEVIECLRFKDGTFSGAKWTLEEAKNVVKQYDVKTKIESLGKTFDCHKFWLALNYVYAVHYSINRTINGYIDLAIDEYTNKNICFDKVIRSIFEKI
jgi:hypothetical protein